MDLLTEETSNQVTTRQYEIVDKIFQQELEEIENQLMISSPTKLKKLNQMVDDRVLKGTAADKDNNK